MFVHGRTLPLVKHSLPKTGREDLAPSSTSLAMKRLCREGPHKPSVLRALAGGQDHSLRCCSNPPLHPPDPPRERKGPQEAGTAGHRISGQAGPANLGQPWGQRALPNHMLGNCTASGPFPS